MNYIYLHGFASGANSYKGTFLRKRFAERGRTLHTPDLNGGDFEHVTLTRQLQLIRRQVDSLPGEITLMGSSMGGYLAALFARDCERVRRLVLLAPAFQFVSRFLERLPEETLRQWQKEGYLTVFHYSANENRRLHYGIIEDARQYDQQVLNRQIPALLIHGRNDESVPYTLSIEYLKQNSAAQLLLLNSDHSLTADVETIWQQVQLFLDIG